MQQMHVTRPKHFPPLYPYIPSWEDLRREQQGGTERSGGGGDDEEDRDFIIFI